MKTIFGKVLIVLALLSRDYFALSQQVLIPPSLKLCPRSSPNLAACMRDSIEHLRPYLKSGDLGNGFFVQGIDPMSTDDVKLESGRGFFFHMTNVKAYMVSNFKIEKIRINLNNLDFELLAEIPHMTTNGDYKINLLLGIANIKGQGKFKSELDNVRIHLKYKGALFKKNGIEYMKFIKIESKVKIPKINLHLYDLFKDKTLNEVTNNLINQNINIFIDDIESNVESNLIKIAYKSSNEIVQKIPFNVLFP